MIGLYDAPQALKAYECHVQPVGPLIQKNRISNLPH